MYIDFLSTVRTADLTSRFAKLLRNPMSAEVTREAIDEFALLFSTEDARGTQFVVESTAGLQDAETTRLSVATLAARLVRALNTGDSQLKGYASHGGLD